MVSLIGAFVVIACVMGGYVAHGGHLGVLIQIEEFIIIGGAAIGSLLIASPISLVKGIIHEILGVLKGAPYGKKEYIDLLKLLYEIIKMAAANPLSLEPHVEKPDASEVFKKYPSVLHNHHALDFLCDTLKVQISASMSPYDLEDLMDADIAVMHEEEHAIPVTINRISDAMPGLGIVAAVLGVVITMGKLTEGKEVIGHSVAAALVGTFIGILISYGFLQPLAAKVEANLGQAGKYVSVIKVALLAYAKGCNAKVCAEFARRSIPPEFRPSFSEVDQATSSAGAKA